MMLAILLPACAAALGAASCMYMQNGHYAVVMDLPMLRTQKV